MKLFNKLLILVLIGFNCLQAMELPLTPNDAIDVALPLDFSNENNEDIDLDNLAAVFELEAADPLPNFQQNPSVLTRSLTASAQLIPAAQTGTASSKTSEKEKKYTCQHPNCLKSFKKGDNLRLHICYKHIAKKYYQCEAEDCIHRFFPTEKDLKSHMHKFHKQFEWVAPQLPENEQKELNDEINQYMPTFLKKKRKAIEPAIKQLDGPAEATHDRTVTTPTQEAAKNPDQIVKISTCAFLCPVCGQGSNVVWELKKHILTHTDLKPFECDVENCGHTFSQSSNFIRHMSKKHSRKANTKLSLDMQRNIAAAIAPFLPKTWKDKCAKCGDLFPSKLSLSNHQIQHSDKQLDIDRDILAATLELKSTEPLFDKTLETLSSPKPSLPSQEQFVPAVAQPTTDLHSMYTDSSQLSSTKSVALLATKQMLPSESSHPARDPLPQKNLEFNSCNPSISKKDKDPSFSVDLLICPQCNMTSFRFLADFKKHILACCTNLKPFECDETQCGFKCIQSNNFVRHMDKKHKRVANIQLSLEMQRNIAKAIRQHLPAWKFECKACHDLFPTIQSLTTHFTKSHSESHESLKRKEPTSLEIGIAALSAAKEQRTQEKPLAPKLSPPITTAIQFDEKDLDDVQTLDEFAVSMADAIHSAYLVEYPPKY